MFLVLPGVYAADAEDVTEQREVVGIASEWITSNYPKVRPTLAGRIAAGVFNHAALNDLSFNLLLALIAVESGFDPKARSHEGARGLTQVMAKHHAEKVRGRDLHNPDVAIEVGAIILRDCYKKFGSAERALRCYSGYQGKPASAYIARVKARARLLARMAADSGLKLEEWPSGVRVSRTEPTKPRPAPLRSHKTSHHLVLAHAVTTSVYPATTKRN